MGTSFEGSPGDPFQKQYENYNKKIGFTSRENTLPPVSDKIVDIAKDALAGWDSTVENVEHETAPINVDSIEKTEKKILDLEKKIMDLTEEAVVGKTVDEKTLSDLFLELVELPEGNDLQSLHRLYINLQEINSNNSPVNVVDKKTEEPIFHLVDEKTEETIFHLVKEIITSDTQSIDTIHEKINNSSLNENDKKLLQNLISEKQELIIELVQKIHDCEITDLEEIRSDINTSLLSENDKELFNHLIDQVKIDKEQVINFKEEIINASCRADISKIREEIKNSNLNEDDKNELIEILDEKSKSVKIRKCTEQTHWTVNKRLKS